MSIKETKAFIELVKSDKAIQKELVKFYNASERNNWDGLIDLADKMGYSFTLEELIKEIPGEFYKGKGKAPNEGWDFPSID